MIVDSANMITEADGEIRQAHDGWIKEGIHSALQRLGDSERDDEFSSRADYDDIEITVSGLDLTQSETKAYKAILILLDKTNYKGNGEVCPVDSEEWVWHQGVIPGLSFTLPEYLKAFGLQRKNGRFSSHQTVEAIKALKALSTKTWGIFYKRNRLSGNQTVTDVVRVVSPVIMLDDLTIFSGLSDGEVMDIESGGDVHGKVVRRVFHINPSPLLMDQVRTFYALRDPDLHNKIREFMVAKGLLNRGSRFPHAVELFIDLIGTYNFPTIQFWLPNLAVRLRLQSWLRNYQWARIHRVIETALHVAQGLGYIRSWEVTGLGKDAKITFSVNPEYSSRLTKKPRAVTKGAA